MAEGSIVSSGSTAAPAAGRWDTSYEWKAITLLGVGFGLVGLDRWIISPLFPFMTEDLGLNYQDLGNIVGALGLMWGVFAIFSGRLSDKIGHRKVLIPAILLFSLMSGLSGLASGIVSLIFIRALMGVMEGAYCPTSFTAVAAASQPSRRGFNQGLQQCGFALLGLGLGPIVATQLLAVVPSWRWVFWIVAIPGFIVGALLFVVLREPAETQGGSLIGAAERGGSWFDVLKSRNIVLSMLALFGAMSCVFVLSAMVPNYLIDYLGLTAIQMGFVTSALGFGGFFGQFAVPGLSDVFGRKLVAIVGFLGSAISVWVFCANGRRSRAAVRGAVRRLVLLSRQCRSDHGADRDGGCASGIGLFGDRHRRRVGRDFRWRRRAVDCGLHRTKLRNPERAARGADWCHGRVHCLSFPQRDRAA